MIAALRRPRYQITVGGISLDRCEAIELSTNNLGQAGTFFLRTAWPSSSNEQNLLSFDRSKASVSISLGFLVTGMPEGALEAQELMSGQIDRVCLDPVLRTVTFEGRDHTAELLDLPMMDNFLNCTSSEVAERLANRCGLAFGIDKTTTLIGQYYQVDHTRIALPRFSRFSTAWDLLISLAQLERFDVWVQGKTLYFRSAGSPTSASYRIDFSGTQPDENTTSLPVTAVALERALPLVSGVTVQVSSWNSRQRKRVTAVSGDGASSSAATLTVLRPNLLQSSAQNLADGIALEASSHAQTMTASMPGDLSLKPRDRVVLTGVGGDWDDIYQIYRIDRELSISGGFTQKIVARTMVT